MPLDFSDWKSVYFPSGGIGSGDHDDPDGDGFDNALEFALRTHPLLPGDASAMLPAITTDPGSGGSTNYRFTYTRPLGVPGVTYTVRMSTNLSSWSTVADVVIASNGSSETRQATVNSSSFRRVFFRLSVTIAP